MHSLDTVIEYLYRKLARKQGIMETQVPFGKKLKDLTPFQEAILTILYLSEMLANYPLEDDYKFFASGRFFLYLNGMIFESYHRKKMRELEDLGWIRVISRGGVLHYGLTDDGRHYKEAHKDLAQSCVIGKLA